MRLEELEPGVVKELEVGGEYFSGNRNVKVVVAASQSAGRHMGNAQVGGIHPHRECEVRGRVTYSVAASSMSRQNRGYYSFSELVAAEAAEDAVTVVGLVRYHNKYGGGRRFATTVFTREGFHRVRGWPKKPLTAQQASQKAIRLLVGGGD